MIAAFILGADKEEKTEKKVTVTKIKEEANTLYSPMEGTIVPLSDVPDETFASEVLGKGFAIQPSGKEVYAPFSGTVVQVMDTKHAIGIQSESGMEVLIHVGIDTVDMNGKGFSLNCAEGDKVECGQCLITFDPEEIRKAGHPDVTMVIVTNTFEYENINIEKTGKVSVMDKVLTV